MDDSNNRQAGIVLYQADGRNVPVQVSYWGDTFWMPQSGMAELFDTSQQNVSLHLKNIYETGELQEESTHKDFLSVRQEGSRNVRRTVAFYNLDAIIAVGYRVNSKQATRFHYAVTRHTAPGIIHERADAGKPHMGLTAWKDAPDGRVHSSDVTIAKNYLGEDEVNRLNRLSGGFLDMIESRIESMRTTTMGECLQLVNTCIRLTGGPPVPDIGKVARKQADVKARAELARYNQSSPDQLSDFERFARGLDRK